MPRGDRTGPDGMGRMTGRGLGYCANYDSPGFTKGFPGGGRGRRFYGRGYYGNMGYGRRFNYSVNPDYAVPQYSAETEKKYLQTEIETLKNEISTLEKRLSQLQEEGE